MSRQRLEEWALLAMAVLTALALLQAKGSPDIPIWMDWTRRCLDLGLVDGYFDLKTDYPPLSVTALWGVARVSGALGVNGVFGLKVSLLAALLATAFVYGRISRSLPRATALLFVLVPCSVGLGYLDVYYAPLLLLAFASLQQEKWGRFGLFFSAACLVKWQPLVLAPFCVVYLWKRGRRPAATAIAAAALPVAALLLVFGPEMFRALGRALTHRPLSAHALNLWWLVTHGLRSTWPETFGNLRAGTANRVYLPGPGLEMLALRLPFLVGYAAALVSLWRREPAFPVLVRHALVGFLTYFMLATGVHENHLFVVVVMAAVLALCDGEGGRAFLIWASVFNANLWLFYGTTGELPMSRVLGLDLALPFAALNLGLFALASMGLREAPRLSLSSAPPGA